MKTGAKNEAMHLQAKDFQEQQEDTRGEDSSPEPLEEAWHSKKGS